MSALFLLINFRFIMVVLKSCLLLFLIFSVGNAEGNQDIYIVKT